MAVIKTMEVGRIIRMCRESKKWSRQKLANSSGMSVYTIITVESGGDCKVSTMERLLDPLGFEIEILKKETEKIKE